MNENKITSKEAYNGEKYFIEKMYNRQKIIIRYLKDSLEETEHDLAASKIRLGELGVDVE